MDTSLFVFGTHSKKHPGSLIFGRLFDHQLLDMVEMSIKKFVSSSTFNVSRQAYSTSILLIILHVVF
jgi:ribosome production factor 2